MIIRSRELKRFRLCVCLPEDEKTGFRATGNCPQKEVDSREKSDFGAADPETRTTLAPNDAKRSYSFFCFIKSFKNR